MIKKFLILPVFLGGILFAQKITNYTGNVSLDNNLKDIHADLVLNYKNEKSDSVAFLLNKYSIINYIKINNKKIKYTESADSKLPDAKKIKFANVFSEHFKLKISYNYSLEKIQFPTFKYNQHWIELSLYTAWFPLNFEDENYSYDLNFKIPNNYKAISSGQVTASGKNKFHLHNSQNYRDILVVLSDKFQKFQSQNSKLDFYGIDLDNKLIQEISQKSQLILDDYQNNFGTSDSEKLIIAVNPYKHQMSYARKGMISLSLKNNFECQDQRILAHEIAHLWWKNASFGTYDEWLNESFAEFSALDWSQKNLPAKEFSELLEKYEDAFKKDLKISQVKPNDDNWFAIVYLKGAYLLYLLKNKIGENKMNYLLKTIYLEKVATTKDFLKLLENATDPETANDFKNKIL